MEYMFRDLKANEIDVRIATINEKGLSLLLYKDARVDMDILDETVGEMNWQRKHLRENANCIIEIWDKEKGQWISKEDTGTESSRASPRKCRPRQKEWDIPPEKPRSGPAVPAGRSAVRRAESG